MKILIWSTFAFFALLWTGCMGLSLAVVSGLADVLSSGAAAGWVQAVQGWQLPAWMAAWVDPAWVQVAQAAVGASIGLLGGTLEGAGPEIATLLGWLKPLLWLAWAVVLMGLLALAGGLHWLVGRPGAAAPTGPARPAV